MAALVQKKMLNTNTRIKKVFFISCLILSFLFSISHFSFAKDCKEYIVKQVYDGDTILIEREKKEKIRLLGIDAFEYNQLPYGPKAKDFLTMLLLKKNVCIETDVDEKDVYGRTLGYVFVNEPLNYFINEELLKSGFAILSDFPPNVKYINRLKKAQVYARKNMLGVWETNNFILETPGEWRKKHPH